MHKGCRSTLEEILESNSSRKSCTQSVVSPFKSSIQMKCVEIRLYLKCAFDHLDDLKFFGS